MTDQLTMAEMRNQLWARGIKFPSTAKRADLEDLLWPATRRVRLPRADLAAARVALAEWDKAIDGDSGDAEHEAGCGLAEVVRQLVNLAHYQGAS
jgi:hypothetical protein